MSQAPGSWQKFFQSCLVIGLIVWALFTLTLGAVYLLFWSSPRVETKPAETATPTLAMVEIGITVEAPPTIPDTPVPIATSTSTNTPVPTETSIPAPTPTPSYELTHTGTVEIYLEPQNGPPSITNINPEVLPSLKIKARTTDLQWIQVCCFIGATKPELWIKTNAVRLLRPELLTSVNQMVPPPTPTAAPTPTHFTIEAGPEFYATTNGILAIFVKVFQGSGGSQTPLPGYMLSVRYKGAGQLEFVDQRATNAGAVSQAAYSSFKNDVHIYNLKYEFDPGTPPEGKKKEEILGTGQWEIWLTNAEGLELSRRTYFETNPQNPNREVFISYGLVR